MPRPPATVKLKPMRLSVPEGLEEQVRAIYPSLSISELVVLYLQELVASPRPISIQPRSAPRSP